MSISQIKVKKMTKYTLVNRNKSTTAKDNSEFVAWMRKHDVQNWRNNQDFMNEYSHRKKIFEKIDLSPENEDAFVEDLKKYNLLVIEEMNQSLWNLFKKK